MKKENQIMISEFFLCIAQYLIILVVLAGIGVLGAFLGIKLRKNKNAKLAAEEEKAAENADEE